MDKALLAEGLLPPEIPEDDLTLDPAERRLNQLGYKQELRREMTLMNTLAISFSTVTLFTGITPLYGSSLTYFGPAGTIWGWFIVSLFTFFVGLAMAEICSSLPTTGSLYFWAAHLAGPRWGPLASWCCAWLETVGLIAAIGTQAFAGAQTLQNIILLATGTAKGGGYFAPCGVFLLVYVILAILWAYINTYPLKVVARIDKVSLWWQIIGGLLFVIVLPLVAPTRQTASFVFTRFETFPNITGIESKAYCAVLSLLVSQYSLYGYDAAATLTEETIHADINGPIAILSSIGLVSVLGWAYMLALTFSIQNFSYLFDPSNETAGSFVPAQILYDAFHGRYQSSTGAILMLTIILGSFFFGGLSITTSASRLVYAFARDGGMPWSTVLREVHPESNVPVNAVWFCAIVTFLLGIPIIMTDSVFTAITSICTIGWVGGYAVPIFARLVIPESKFQRGRFHLGFASKFVCLVAFLWIFYTVSVFLLPRVYPINLANFNFASVTLPILLVVISVWWLVSARKWFEGPVKNI